MNVERNIFAVHQMRHMRRKPDYKWIMLLFMCSGQSSFITGSNHVVDGGRLYMYQPYQPITTD